MCIVLFPSGLLLFLFYEIYLLIYYKTLKYSIMRKTFIVMWILCCFQLSMAQSIYLTEKNGNSTKIELSNFRSITFSTGNLFMNLKTGAPTSYALADVRSLKFLPPILGQKLVSQNSLFSLFPNPVNDIVTLVFSGLKSGNSMVEVVDLQGEIILQKTFNGESINDISINLSALQSGMYFCRHINGNQISSTKFIKK